VISTLPAALSLHAFQDPSGTMGRLAYDLGNVYTASPVQMQNGTIMFWALQWTLEEIGSFPNATPEPFERCLAALEEVAPLLGTDSMQRPDAELVRREFAQTIRLMRHACRRGILAPIRMPPMHPIWHVPSKPTCRRSSASTRSCGWPATAPAV
jgi:hexosaminidase